MTTNLLCTLVITLLTNVIQSDNAVWGPDPFIVLPTWPPQPVQKIVTPATEHYQTTNISEHLTLRWAWAGQTHDHTVDRLLSSVTRVNRLRQQWEECELRTNATETVVYSGVISIPNGIVATNNLFLEP